MGNSVKVLVMEDEFIVAEEISEILKQKNYEVIGTVADGKGALELVHKHKPDVVLLDINIKGDQDGIEVGSKIREQNDQVAIIYLTAFDDEDHIKRAKETGPSAYIVKPFDERNLLIAIDVAFSNLQKNDTEEQAKEPPFILKDRIYIKDRDKYVKLMIGDILYIEAVGSYCEIVTEGKKFTFSVNLKHLSAKFSHEHLIRIHRSFIVNIDKIDSIRGNQVYIAEKGISIGNSYRESFSKKFKLI